MGGETRNIAFQLVLQEFAKQVACFCCQFYGSFIYYKKPVKQKFDDLKTWHSLLNIVSKQIILRELKHQRRRRQRKGQLKSEFALPQTLSRLVHLVSVCQMLAFFTELNSNRLYRSS